MSFPAARPPQPDPALCPLCGGPNGCAMASPPDSAAGPAACGRSTDGVPCWCTQVQFTREVLARVPAHAHNLACICAKCATGAP